MKIVLVAIGARKGGAMEEVAKKYAVRASRYLACETQGFEGEAQFLRWLERQAGREPAYAILLDRTGEMLSSEEFAGCMQRLRDGGTQRVVLAIGPADGWSEAALGRAGKVISFGRMTLPHELARVVLAEQVYRALTILAGHPYHSGH